MPDRKDFDTGPIVFGDGVAAGGNAHLSVFSDGTYSMTGHFHASGLPSYDVSVVFIVADDEGRPISFGHTGRVHGTLEPGSRDHDFAGTENDPMIQQLWPTGFGDQGEWKANVNINIQEMIDAAKNDVSDAALVASVFV
ncbi:MULTISPECIES: hypothetical protein [Streptomyces]|uniref:Uncharacterized protein n=1 Tax=Streptomyces misionensis TaxID=67331 RepID=A0A1H5DWJ3_9ACTN|nr:MULTISPECIES: hypothetical protein [Streptomyces]SED83247.1 hypothetical protein SAMN04490357_5991 [Streptomyces misionensis]SFY48935.1 hypothetical protein STEPF1_02162 [Streptomyces sp. F-1]